MNIILTPEEYQSAIIEFNHQVFFSDGFDSLENIIAKLKRIKIYDDYKSKFIVTNDYYVPSIKNGLKDLKNLLTIKSFDL